MLPINKQKSNGTRIMAGITLNKCAEITLQDLIFSQSKVECQSRCTFSVPFISVFFKH